MPPIALTKTTSDPAETQASRGPENFGEATAGRRREGHLIVAHYEVVGRVSKGDRLLRLPQPISVISTISGGQFIRIGRSTMPIP
jgi:hypothetical protein